MIHGIIDDLCKTILELRKKLRSAGFANAETLVPQRGNPVTFPCSRSVIVGKEFVDGYLRIS